MEKRKISFRRIKSSFVGLAFMLIGTFSSCINCYAVSSSISLSPMIQRVLLTPGETYKTSVQVSNMAASTEDLYYSVSVGAFSESGAADSKDDYGAIDVDTVYSYNQMMEWIKLEKTEGIVEPNGVDTIPFSIVVPKDAPAGGQYATIIVQNNTPSAGNGNGNISIKSEIQIASTIYAEVAGETREEGDILENNAPSFLFNGPLEATSRVRNDGNVHTDAKFTLQVWPLFSSEEICTNEEDPATSLIMPDSERFHTETCTLPAVGVFKMKQVVEIFGKTDILEKTIIVCPLWLMLIVAFIVVALIIWLFIRAKNHKK